MQKIQIDTLFIYWFIHYSKYNTHMILIYYVNIFRKHSKSVMGYLDFFYMHDLRILKNESSSELLLHKLVTSNNWIEEGIIFIKRRNVLGRFAAWKHIHSPVTQRSITNSKFLLNYIFREMFSMCLYYCQQNFISNIRIRIANFYFIVMTCSLLRGEGSTHDWRMAIWKPWHVGESF